MTGAHAAACYLPPTVPPLKLAMRQSVENGMKGSRNKHGLFVVSAAQQPSEVIPTEADRLPSMSVTKPRASVSTLHEARQPSEVTLCCRGLQPM